MKYRLYNCINKSGDWKLKTGNSHLKAFTVIELIVTMVLSSIVIAAAMSLYLNYESLIRKKNDQMNCGKENLQFYNIFKHEFDKACLIKTSGSEVTLLQPDKTIVQYEFEQEFIIRFVNEAIDTFRIDVYDFETVKDAITGGDKIIKMELRNCGEICPVYLVKQYSNEILMNSENK